MEIANRDQIIDALRSEIDRVKGGVLDQLQDIGEIQKENEFLTEIVGDYKKYRNHMNYNKYKGQRFTNNYKNYAICFLSLKKYTYSTRIIK